MDRSGQMPGEKANSRNFNMQLVFGITLMSVMGVAIIAPAFPRIVQELKLSPGRVGLLITVFTLPGVVLTPLLGVLADRIGRKVILVPALLLFGIAGTACTFVRDFDLLLVLRFFQGTGAAPLAALNVTVIGDLYAGRRRAEVLGYNAGVLSIGTASYPALGGALAAIGWYYPFALSAAAIPLALLVWKYLDGPPLPRPEKLGAYFRNVFIGFTDPRVTGLFAAALIAFIILYGSYVTYFPLLLGGKFSAGPATIGLIMASMSVTTAITSTRSGSLGRRFRRKTLIVTGFLLYAASMIVVPQVAALPWFLLATVLFGMAQGVNIPVLQTELNDLAPDRYRAAYMATSGLSIRVGQTVGPLLMHWVETRWQIEAAFYAGALLALAGAAVMAATVRSS